MEGRYHSSVYASAAAELGLNVGRERDTGWAVTSLTDVTAEKYAPVIKSLDEALRDWEPPVPPSRASRADMRNGEVWACQCDPPRKLRARETTLAVIVTPVLCSICGSAFRPGVQAVT
jgi:hypothetical protein